jgi:hypothetical protein
MGTRADFYIGRGKDAQWLGSIAYDGYPSGNPSEVVLAKDEAAFKTAVEALDKNDHYTSPEQGWPWPWKSSQTTDYAYAWDDGKVWISCFGHRWITLAEHDGLHDGGCSGPKVEFPDMTEQQNIAHGKRSGVLLVGG